MKEGERLFDYTKVPDELKALPIWCIYVADPQPETTKLKKVPMDPVNARPLSSNSDVGWTDFKTAINAYQNRTLQAAGVGLLVKKPYLFIDLDKKTTAMAEFLNDHTTDNLVSEFIKATNGSYAEYSISKTGIHILAKGEKLVSGSRKGEIEIYSEKRFVALTGEVFNRQTTLEHVNTQKFNELCQKYLPNTQKIEPTKLITGKSLIPNDRELIKKAVAAENGEKFNRLYNGDYSGYPSVSEATIAFANLLAFWTGKDIEQMDRIIRDSGLMRAKYESKRGNSTWGYDILLNAVATVDTTYKRKQTLNYSIDFNKGDKLPVGDFTDMFDPAKKGYRGYFSYDDTGNAQRFYHAFKNKFIYLAPSNEFRFWNGRQWKLDDNRIVYRCYEQVVRVLPEEPLHISKDLLESQKDSDKDMVKAIRKKHDHFLSRSRSHSGKVNAVEEIKTLIAIPPSKIDANTELINTSNTVIQVDSKEPALHFLKHQPQQYLTKITKGGIVNEFPKRSRWAQFLNEVFLGDVETINFMQRAVGYSLVGRGRERKLFILYGNDDNDDNNGSNGKSVFTQTISNVLGDYAWKMKPETLIVNQSSFGSGAAASPDIANLEGKRFVTTSELANKAKLDEAKVKSLTSGEMQNARKLYSDETNFMPLFTIWLTTNYKPEINGTDSAIWKRLIYVPFLAKFSEDTKPKLDVNLPDKLAKESDVIFSWIVQGAKQYLQRGLDVPQTILDNNVAERAKQDVIQRFANECLVITNDESDQLQTAEIADAFMKWVNANKIAYSKTKFYKVFGDRFAANYKRTNNGRLYTGMRFETGMGKGKTIAFPSG
ncbi:MAG: phage/plasmid primase, P4 family [Lentilactobacillus hilgardii]|uniref:phage/plasmid primase, P4 family n=1 Tax=Lentilactobacillus hilgardii TaxID=1588 RepID=UPI001DE1D779|nr:hypothetical protein [Lentilactobacillus hilgardii]MBZ2203176.1 hypothetical protein [Lentilactobacillus hilgardii]